MAPRLRVARKIPIASIPDNTCVIEGMVIDERGNRVGGVTIGETSYTWDYDPNHRKPVGRGVTTSEDDGSFVLRGDGACANSVLYAVKGTASAVAFPLREQDSQNAFDPVVVQIREYPAEIHVLDIANAPLAGAAVTLHGDDGQVLTRSATDASGTARFIFTWDGDEVRVDLNGYRHARFGLRVFGDREMTATIHLERTGGQMIRGRLVDHLGRPVPNLRVATVEYGDDTGHANDDITDADGRFSFSVSEAESHVIEASLPPGDAHGELEVTPGVTDVTLALGPPPHPPVDVIVTVVDARGRPVPDAVFEEHPRKMTDENGRYIATRRCGDRIWYHARKDGYATEPFEGAIPNQLTADPPVPVAVTLHLVYKTRVTGTVVDPDGTPLAGASVRNSWGGGGASDAAGRFIVDDFWRDTYTLYACYMRPGREQCSPSITVLPGATNVRLEIAP